MNIGLNHFRDLCYLRSYNAGWWDDLDRNELTNKLLRATKIGLIHSEVSEMLEGLRKGNQDDHLPHRTMEEVECVDILIRVFDYAGHRGFDLDTIIKEKLNYNTLRS